MLLSNLHQAQYGNALAQYGQIQLGHYGLPIRNYGGWPKQEVEIRSVPNFDPEEQNEDDNSASKPVPEVPAGTINENRDTIRFLRQQLIAEDDLARRQIIRKKLIKAKQDKEGAYRLKAMLDEEEAQFILF